MTDFPDLAVGGGGAALIGIRRPALFDEMLPNRKIHFVLGKDTVEAPAIKISMSIYLVLCPELEARSPSGVPPRLILVSSSSLEESMSGSSWLTHDTNATE